MTVVYEYFRNRVQEPIRHKICHSAGAQFGIHVVDDESIPVLKPLSYNSLREMNIIFTEEGHLVHPQLQMACELRVWQAHGFVTGEAEGFEIVGTEILVNVHPLIIRELG